MDQQMKDQKEAIKELMQIPGVGKVIAQDLCGLGYTSIRSLKGQDPDQLYVLHNKHKGVVQDICMLYTFRCAVYFANTIDKKQDPEKLKWWNWMDKEKISSIDKDMQIRMKNKEL